MPDFSQYLLDQEDGSREWLETFYMIRKDFGFMAVPDLRQDEVKHFRRWISEDVAMAKFLLRHRYNGSAPKTNMEFTMTMPASVVGAFADISRQMQEIDSKRMVPTVNFRFEFLNLYSQMRCLDRSHRFVVSRGLATKLWNTSPDGIPTKFLCPPFPTIQIEIEGEEIPLGDHTLRLVWKIWQENEEDIPSCVNFPLKRQCVHCLVCLHDDKSNRTTVAGYRTAMLSDDDIKIVGYPEDLRLIDFLPYTGNDLMNFAFNVLLYVNLRTKDSVEDKTAIHQIHSQLQGLKGNKRKSLEEKLAEAKRRPIFILGKSIPLPNGAPPEALLLTDSPQRRTHWRRGHWRQQACGKHWSEHKWIHIEPVLVSGYGEAIIKDYVVDKENAPSITP